MTDWGLSSPVVFLVRDPQVLRRSQADVFLEAYIERVPTFEPDPGRNVFQSVVPVFRFSHEPAGSFYTVFVDQAC